MQQEPHWSIILFSGRLLIQKQILVTLQNFWRDSGEVESDKDDLPPTPWAKSSTKTRIGVKLSDLTSDIHFFISQYNRRTLTESMSRNFLQNMQTINTNKVISERIWIKYWHIYRTKLQNWTIPRNYIRSTDKCIEALVYECQLCQKSILNSFLLLMSDTDARTLAWNPHFQLHELEKFEEYHKNMVKQTCISNTMLTLMICWHFIKAKQP